MSKTSLNVSVEEETKKKAKILAVELGINASELVEFLIQSLTEKDIEKLKKQYEKEKK